MYKPQKIIDLLNQTGITKKTLLDYLGKNWNGSLSSIINGDIRVSKLEKIADFFGVPIDEFFDRESDVNGVRVGCIRNNVSHSKVSTTPEVLQQLIEEKDKRIALLEDMVAILKAKN